MDSTSKITKLQKQIIQLLCNTGQEDTFNLTDINIEWLAVVLDRCCELIPSPKKRPSESVSDKELWTFLYPYCRFQRNTPDWRIIAGYEKYSDRTPEVIKLRPDEFAEMINDDMFNDQEYYVRFIELPPKKNYE